MSMVPSTRSSPAEMHSIRSHSSSLGIKIKGGSNGIRRVDAHSLQGNVPVPKVPKERKLLVEIRGMQDLRWLSHQQLLHSLL